MSRILFLIPSTSNFLFQVFSNAEYEYLVKDSTEKNAFGTEDLKNTFFRGIKIKWKNYDIDILGIRFYEYDDYQYDKVYMFSEIYGDNKFTENDFINYKKERLSVFPSDYDTSNVEIVILYFDEILNINSEIHHKVLEHKNITCCNIAEQIHHRNYFYSLKLGLLFFYYYIGLYFTTFTFTSKKTNLLGYYHTNGYKGDRDRIIKNIKNTFDKKYLKNYTKSKFSVGETMDLFMDVGWKKNHVNGYADIINSCVFLNFESDGIGSYLYGKYHITEKTLKSILFSKLGIPSILYASDRLLIELYDAGFWFLNYEFLNIEALRNLKSITERRDLLEKSIIDSIYYCTNIFDKNNGNIENVSKELQILFGDKMNKNYELFIDITKDKQLNNQLLDFILNIKNVI